jgi:hypothetical protein
MAFPTPPSPGTPIPNDPFYFPAGNSLNGNTGPFIVGVGLVLDNTSGVLYATGEAAGIVNSIVAGPGIQVSGSAIDPIVTNTGVLSINAGVGIVVSNVNGIYTVSNNATPGVGTVTSVTAGPGLLGGTIINSGTISLPTTGVAPATYTNPTITVDAFGRITYIAPSGGSIIATAPLSLVGNTLSVGAASTVAPGVVQLSDSTSSTSITLAATAKSVKLTYDQAFIAVNTANAASLTANAAIGAVNSALPLAGGTMTGIINFAAGQTFPGTVIPDATTASKGVVQVGANIQVAGGVISVLNADTSQSGVVQLNNTTNSTSTTEALTAAQGKILQEQITNLAVSSNITLGGTYDANTGLVDSVTAQGTTAGLVVGSPLPAPDSVNAEVFVIVDVQGSSGPNAPTVSHVGDWFLSDGTTWQFLNVGFQPGQATTVSQGVVQLATDAQVQAGTDSSNAVVSSSLQSKLSDSVSTTSSTTIASSTAVKNAYDAAVAAQGSGSSAQADATQALTNAATAQTTADAAQTDATQALADSATAQTTADAAQVDATQALADAATSQSTADSAQVDATQALADAATAQTAANAAQIDATQALSDAATAQATANAAIPCATITAVGDLLTGSATSTPSALSVGTNGQVLSANSACALGMEWVTASSGGSLCGETAIDASRNTYLGYCAANYDVSAGCCNTAIGSCAAFALNQGVNTTALGAFALCGVAGSGAVGTVTTTALSTPGPALAGFTSGMGGATIVSAPTRAATCCYTNVPTTTLSGSGSGAALRVWYFSAGNSPNISVTTPGSGYAVGDQFKVLGTDLGGTSPADDATFTVSFLQSVTYTGVAQCATSGVGSLYVGNVVRNGFTGVVSSVALNTGGQNYKVGDNITLPGTSVGGTSPTNDVVVTVTAASFPNSVNTAIGYQAGCAITSGCNNTLVGGYVGTASMCDTVALSTGGGSVRFMANCCGAWSYDGTNFGTSGQFLISRGTGQTPTWTNNPAQPATPGTVGVVNGCTTSQNTSIGSNVLGCNITTGRYNTAVGGSAAYWMRAGCHNTAVGSIALFAKANEDTSRNTAVGSNAMANSGGGSDSTSIGFCAGYQLAGFGAGGGCQNTLMGSYAGSSLCTGTNNIVLGYCAQTAANSSSNTVTLGNASITTLRAQVTTITALSDARDKTDITALPVGLDFVNTLNPVKFTWQMREPNEVKDGTSEAGFIAQDLKTAQEAAGADYLGLVYDENPDKLEASAGKLLPVLVKAIQELSTKVEVLEAKLANG